MNKFYADINCPFCFILNEWLHELNLSDQIDWIGVEHEPELNQKIAKAPGYQKKYNEEIKMAMGRAEGIEISIAEFRPSSNMALSVLQYIKEELPESFVESKKLIYRTLWQDGVDVSNLDNLKKLLPIISNVELLKIEKYQKKVKEDTMAWRGLKYDRIPMAISRTSATYLGLGNKAALNSFIHSGSFSEKDMYVCLPIDKNEVLKNNEKELSSIEDLNNLPLLREMIELTIDPIFLVDKENTIKVCNLKACQILNKKFKNLIGEKITELLPGLDVDLLHRLFKVNYTYKEDTWEVISNKNAKSLLALSFRNITQRMRFDRELADKNILLQDAIESKNKFLAMISHEMRTPLNGVLGLTEYIIDNFDTKEFKPELENIKGSGQILLSIINDLLDISSLENGKLIFNTEPVNLKSEINFVLNNMKSLFVEKNNSTNLSISKGIDENVLCDPIRLKQIIFNLVGNANKFTSNGRIEIKLRAGKNKRTRFEVHDTGEGIKEEDLQKIFSAFTKLEQKSFKEGTGLGLTICRAVVGEIGGEIGVRSTYGKGSVFFFELDLKCTECKPVLMDDKTNFNFLELGHRLPTILIVEDNKINQIILEKIVLKIGITPVIVENGELAVNYCENEKPDIIFMDQHMPVLNGIEATEKIRNELGNTESYIVGFSAANTESQKQKCLDAGMNDFLAKPANHNDIVQIFHKFSKRNK